MLDTREVRNLRTLCPAGMPIAETRAGSAILCRVTGRVVATGTDPSSLQAFCCYPRAWDQDMTADGRRVPLGYQNCPIWTHNRQRELREKLEFAEGTPDRVKEAMQPQFVTRAS